MPSAAKSVRLGELQGLAGVEVVDFGIRGLDLAYALADRCDVAILIHATAQNSPPGTLHRLELELNAADDSADQATPLLDAHSMDPMKVLRLVARWGAGFAGWCWLVASRPIWETTKKAGWE